MDATTIWRDSDFLDDYLEKIDSFRNANFVHNAIGNRYEWENLPDEITQQKIETILKKYGKINVEIYGRG